MAENFSNTAADRLFSLLLTDLPDLLQGERDEFRMFLRSLSPLSRMLVYFEPAKFRDFLLRSDDFVGGHVVSMSDVFRKLKEFIDAEKKAYGDLYYGDRNHLSQTYYLDIGSSSGTQSDIQGSQASHDAMATATSFVYVLHPDGYISRTPSHVLSSSDDPQSGNFGYDPSTMNMGAREMISNETSTHRNFEAGTQHHTQRTLPDQHNIHLDGANTQSHFTSVPVPDTLLSNPNYGASAESYLQRSSHQNPAGRVRAFPAMSNIHLNYSTGTPSRPHISMASRGNPPDRQMEFSYMSNSLPNYAALTQSHSQRPLASLNNPPGHDGTIIIPAEARATRDDETAGHSKLIKTLVPVNFTNAYKAAKILMSTYHSPLPLFIKTFGFLTVGFAAAAVFSSLAGLSLSTFRPNTLPFGCNPQVMIRLMHNVVVHTTAYAFIGTMCHQFLQDDPSIMWIVAGLASAVFMTLMLFIGWRR